MTEKVSRGGAVSIPAFGYDIVDKKYQVNPINAPIVQRIFIKYLNGVGCRAIANELNDLGIKNDGVVLVLSIIIVILNFPAV